MYIKLLVLKTSLPELLAKQYGQLGILFEYHQHGHGPFHYAGKIGELVFEIYPLPKSKYEADNTTRIGFSVNKLNEILTNISETTWKITSPASYTEWGYSCVLEDLDGRKVELTEIST